MKISRYHWNDLEPSALQALIGDSLFASAGFMRLWETVGGRPVAWVGESEGEITAVLPGIEFGREPLLRFQAMPDGCYGQIFFKSSVPPDDRARTAGLFSEVLCQIGYVKLFLYDYHNTFTPALDMEVVACSTQLVDISAADWLPPDKKLQSEIRKSEREGVAVEAFDSTRHMTRFLELMRLTENRHKRKPKYPPEFFHALAELSQIERRIIWTWCEHEGHAVSSHINLIEDEMVLNWQVYYDKTYSFLKSNQFMLHALARQTASRGVKTLNLGASPSDADSLSSYKEKWGSRTYR